MHIHNVVSRAGESAEGAELTDDDGAESDVRDYSISLGIYIYICIRSTRYYYTIIMSLL